MDARTIARRLAALPAAAMRRAVLRELLDALDRERAAQLCGELVRRGPDGAPYDGALLTLAALLDRGELDYDRRSELYAAARALGDELLARLLLSSLPPPGATPPVAAPAVELTLGERKSLARGRRRDALDWLLRDPDQSVVAILLGNPRITEEDVVRLAARRNAGPAALRTIFASERFCVRYPVRRALVMNPATPSDLAARLVVLLNRMDLRAVADDPVLAAPVRQAARDLLGA